MKKNSLFSCGRARQKSGLRAELTSSIRAHLGPAGVTRRGREKIAALGQTREPRGPWGREASAIIGALIQVRGFELRSMMDNTKRRRPRQKRSQRRVASILDAAAELLEEVGYRALTTNAIAAKAGTSIGSIYQFFPNKNAVVAEVVRGFRNQLDLILDQVLTVDLARQSVTRLVDVLVDSLEGLAAATPGFGSIFTGSKFGGSAEEQALELEKDIIEPLSDLLAQAYPNVSDEQRRLCMLVVTETTKVLMSRAAVEDRETQRKIRQELKRMLGLYLASHFEAPRRRGTRSRKSKK